MIRKLEFCEEVEKVYGPVGSDPLVFSGNDGERDIQIGLIDVLKCLKFAEENGVIPEMPRPWWWRVKGAYVDL